MTEVPDLAELSEAPKREDDVPSMRAYVFCKDPTETFELDIVNLEGVVIGVRIDASALLYIPWARIKHIEIPQSLNAADDD